jgi:hypothetical protein
MKTLFGFPVRVDESMPKDQIMLVSPGALAPQVHQHGDGREFLSFNAKAVTVIRGLQVIRSQDPAFKSIR